VYVLSFVSITFIYTTIKTTRLTVMEVDGLSGAGWVWSTRYGVKWAWLAGHGRCMESRPELETV